MRLWLPFAPTPDNARRFSDLAVHGVRATSGLDLDGSVGSLATVDRVVLGMRRDRATTAEVAERLFILGCYVGEVLLAREQRGSWRETGQTAMHRKSPSPLVLELPGRGVCDPVGVMFELLERGRGGAAELHRVLTNEGSPGTRATRLRWLRRFFRA